MALRSDSPAFFAPVAILNGTALSAAINIGNKKIVGIVMPAAWTAAGLSLQACDTLTGTYSEVASVSAVVAITAAAGQVIVIDPATMPALPFIKVRSGTSGVPVNQGADRALTLITA